MVLISICETRAIREASRLDNSSWNRGISPSISAGSILLASQKSRKNERAHSLVSLDSSRDRASNADVISSTRFVISSTKASAASLSGLALAQGIASFPCGYMNARLLSLPWVISSSIAGKMASAGICHRVCCDTLIRLPRGLLSISTEPYARINEKIAFTASAADSSVPSATNP